MFGYIFISLMLLAPPQAEQVTFRIITVPTEARAAELRARLLAGESFEALAREYSVDPSAANGGMIAGLSPADLRPELQNALAGLQPGGVSPVFKTDNQFSLVELASAAEAEWLKENAAALDALQKGRHGDAARSFSRAVRIAEGFGADDERLGRSLNGWAEALRLEEDFAGARDVYRRILSIRWAAGKADGAVADMVDRFADVLSLAFFRESPAFNDALKKYHDALSQTPPAEALYLAMCSLLVKAELNDVAADVMERAAAAFPESRRVRYKQAEMFRDSGKMRKALETFQQASQMKAPAGMKPDLDRLQLSFIYQRIGGINTDLTQFDSAITAYKKSLEISPDNADARIALGDAYLRRGQYSEALAEYGRVLQMHPDKALPYYRIADANLQMGNFAEAATAAAKALNIDPALRKARYVYGTALARMGRVEEGQKELENYGEQEARAQADMNSQRDIIVSNRGASALALGPAADEGIALFRKSIEAHPEAVSLRLNLGITLEMAARAGEAAALLRNVLDSGVSSDFLIYRTLARIYADLHEEKASQEYGALYVRQVDAALEQELQ